MINRFFFLFSALVFLIGNTSSGVASGSFPTHTQYTPELKPASLDNSYQLASVCFLGGGAGCGDANFGKGDSGYEVDTSKQCKNEGFVNSCSSGYCMDHSCPYNGNYGKCLKENCPTNSSTTCTGAIDGKNACGANCRKCCDDNCPTYTSKTYKGALASKTECGNNCYKCNCPSGTAPNFSGAASGTAECGTCYKCSTTCTRGSTSTSCPSKYKAVRIGSTECGGSCYECQYNYDCEASSVSCEAKYKCNYNSCGICSSCSYNYDCDASDESCSYGCERTNSCGKCTKCKTRGCSDYSCYEECSSSGHTCSYSNRCTKDCVTGELYNCDHNPGHWIESTGTCDCSDWRNAITIGISRC